MFYSIVEKHLLSLRRYIKDDSLINARDDSEEDGKGHNYRFNI